MRQNLLADGITNLNEFDVGDTGRRLNEFGPRGSQIDRTTLRVAADLDIELTDTLGLNVYSTWGKTASSSSTTSASTANAPRSP